MRIRRLWTCRQSPQGNREVRPGQEAWHIAILASGPRRRSGTFWPTGHRPAGTRSLLPFPLLVGGSGPLFRPSQQHDGYKNRNDVDPHFVDSPEMGKDAQHLIRIPLVAGHRSTWLDMRRQPLTSPAHCGCLRPAQPRETLGIQEHHGTCREPGRDQVDQEMEPHPIGRHHRTVHQAEES